jgi:hypothetical protein
MIRAWFACLALTVGMTAIAAGEDLGKKTPGDGGKYVWVPSQGPGYYYTTSQSLSSSLTWSEVGVLVLGAVGIFLGVAALTEAKGAHAAAMEAQKIAEEAKQLALAAVTGKKPA